MDQRFSSPNGAERFLNSVSSVIRYSDEDGAVIGTRKEEFEKKKAVPFPPFRFSVEFWGIGDLKEKQRLYGGTVFYGGVSLIFLFSSIDGVLIFWETRVYSTRISRL
jgi:hypothetical protein